MKKLLIVYHSQSGNTEQLAKAIAEGVRREQDVELLCKRAIDADIDDLLAADSALFGTPENFGYMSGMLKDFFDRTFYPAEPYQLGLPYGLFVSAGNDGTGAVREIDRILIGYPMRKVAEPLIVTGDITETNLVRCRELGEGFAAATAMGAF